MQQFSFNRFLTQHRNNINSTFKGMSHQFTKVVSIHFNKVGAVFMSETVSFNLKKFLN